MVSFEILKLFLLSTGKDCFQHKTNNMLTDTRRAGDDLTLIRHWVLFFVTHTFCYGIYTQCKYLYKENVFEYIHRSSQKE